MTAKAIEAAESERSSVGDFASAFRILKQYLIAMDHVVAWSGVVLIVSVILIYAVVLGINALDAMIGLPQGFVQGVGNVIGKAGPIVMLTAIIVYPRMLLALIGHFCRKRASRRPRGTTTELRSTKPSSSQNLNTDFTESPSNLHNM